MIIRRKSSINKINYELSGQLSLFGKDNFDYKKIDLAKSQKYISLCRFFKLKKIILQKKIFFSYLEIH